jgi:hypothetical protein
VAGRTTLVAGLVAGRKAKEKGRKEENKRKEGPTVCRLWLNDFE